MVRRFFLPGAKKRDSCNVFAFSCSERCHAFAAPTQRRSLLSCAAFSSPGCRTTSGVRELEVTTSLPLRIAVSLSSHQLYLAMQSPELTAHLCFGESATYGLMCSVEISVLSLGLAFHRLAPLCRPPAVGKPPSASSGPSFEIGASVFHFPLVVSSLCCSWALCSTRRLAQAVRRIYLQPEHTSESPQLTFFSASLFPSTVAIGFFVALALAAASVSNALSGLALRAATRAASLGKLTPKQRALLGLPPADAGAAAGGKGPAPLPAAAAAKSALPPAGGSLLSYGNAYEPEPQGLEQRFAGFSTPGFEQVSGTRLRHHSCCVSKTTLPRAP